MTITLTAHNDPVLASPAELAQLQVLDALLSAADADTLQITDGRRQLALPGTTLHLLRRAVHQLAQGQAVSIVPLHKEVTTQQAADLLHVSQPYLIHILDQGAIPYNKTGTHRRIRVADVLAYKRQRDAQRRQALDELTHATAEMGLYDLEDPECRI